MFAGAFAANRCTALVVFLSCPSCVCGCRRRWPQSRAATPAAAPRTSRQIVSPAPLHRRQKLRGRLLCLMSFVMNGAPLAMVACGFSPDEGCPWHLLARDAHVRPELLYQVGLIAASAKETIVINIGMVLLIGWRSSRLPRNRALAVLDLAWSLPQVSAGTSPFIGSNVMVAQTYRPSRNQQRSGVSKRTSSPVSDRPRLLHVRRGL